MSDLLKLLQPYKGCKIAIYGLGLLTEEILHFICPLYQVVGLLDGYRTDGMLYGKSIISLEEAVQADVKLILVAARPESCKIIAKRIGAMCRENQIDLLDRNGTDLLKPKIDAYHLKWEASYCKQALLETLMRHESVSVDFFDTLMMRQTLFSSDVFDLVDIRLRQRGIRIDRFSSKRLEGEKELLKQTVPTLPEIYAYIKQKYGFSGISPEELAELEWNVDRNLLVPRKELCDLLADVHRRGTPVYIVTDTFYKKEQISRFLAENGIHFHTEIITSCEYRTSKTQGLFQKLLERIPCKSCIHIGDSEDADVSAARANGLTGWKIHSGLEMFEQTGYLGMWDAISGLSGRVQTGMFVSRLFNSPFLVEEDNKKVTARHAADIGFLFFAPLITSFVFWFRQQVRAQGLKNVWFCARDGWLIKTLYDLLEGPSPTCVYFLTSRIAAIRAGVETEEDIRYIEEMRFSGSLQEHLKTRFGIELEPETANENGLLLNYKREIMTRAAVCRKNYLAYINGLAIDEGPIALFDFVARGTCQMYLGRLVKQPMVGFYFMQQDPEYMKINELDILPFYGKEDGASSAVLENYYILEVILTSPEPSLSGFDSFGTPLYAEETREKKHLQCIQDTQDGIKEYFLTWCRLYPYAPEDRALGELCLRALHDVAISVPDFLELNVEDPFFNRTNKVSDLL